MKRQLLFTGIFMLVVSGLYAQKEVYLKIEHLLGTEAFSFNTPATAPGGEKVSLSRLDYYISQIILVHDGGQMTEVPDTWILVHGDQAVNTKLGDFNINTLEEIRFGVGVEQEVNHLDPAQYDPSHPLAPRLPAMHWGWLAGYRFAAIDGKTGEQLSNIMEIHALGDGNYFQLVIPTAGTENGNTLEIELKANYLEALNGIALDNELIYHGEEDQAITMMNNFATRVFRSSEGNQSVLNVASVSQTMDARLYPNPSFGNLRIRVPDNAGSGEYTLRVYDMQGKLVEEKTTDGKGDILHMEQAGTYLVVLTQEGVILNSATWVVQ